MPRKQVTVGKEWQRHEFTFVPTQPFLFIAVGLDLEASKREAATLWLDAVQLERGNHATDYEPRQPVESFIETGTTGNIFTNVEAGLAFTLRAFNDTYRERPVLAGSFYADGFLRSRCRRGVFVDQVAAHSAGSVTRRGVAKGRSGFFRATWTTPGFAQSLRCAIIDAGRAGRR